MRRLSHLALLVLALVGCSPGTTDAPLDTDLPVDTDDTEAVDADLPDGSTPWGPAGSALPPGARTITLEELQALATSTQLQPIDPTARQAAIDAELAAQAADEALVAAFLVDHPEFADRIPGDTPIPGVTLLPDGNRRIEVGDTTAILQGPKWAFRDLAHTLRAAEDRNQRDELYRTLHARLPTDRLTDLPAPNDVEVGEAEAAQKALDRLTHRAIEVLPATLPPEQYEPWGEATGAALPATGCEEQTTPFLDEIGLPLRPFLPEIRDQGGRGTCVAFGATAALEIATGARYGLRVDLSEQELYGEAKTAWYPSASQYGDGLPTGQILFDLLDAGYRAHGEGLWPYNPSRQRVDLENTESYRDSCVNYDGPCSETNHQLAVVCTEIAGNEYCYTWSPRRELDQVTTGVRTTMALSVWNLLRPEASFDLMRALVEAGIPVLLAVAVDEQLRAGVGYPGGDPSPLIFEDVDDVAKGSHAITVVGFVTNASIVNSERYGPEQRSARGGYFVVRNSWGCAWGESGYIYLSADWLAEHIHSATALVQVRADLPTVDLGANVSVVTAERDVRFTASTNDLVAEVSLFRDGELVGTDDDAPFTFDVPITAEQNGTSAWWAEASDGTGNGSVSQPFVLSTWIKDEGPTVTLTAAGTWAVAPGVVGVTVTAADEDLVSSIELWHGLDRLAREVVGTLSTERTFTLPLDAGDLGAYNVYAVATDVLGRVTRSEVLTIDVLGGPPPTLDGPLVDRSSLPDEGGTVTVYWTAVGADTVTLDPGGIDVTGQSEAEVTIPENLSAQEVSVAVTVRATNAWATVTRSTTVRVAGATLGGLYVHPTLGNDGSADGSLALPYATIAAAAAALPADGALVLADGTHVLDGDVLLPAGTRIEAQHAHAARLVSSATAAPFVGRLVFEGSGEVDGLDLGDLYPAIAADNGLLDLVDVKLSGSLTCREGQGAPLALSGTVAATWTPGLDPEAFVPATEIDCLARLTGDAELFVVGATFSDRSSGSPADAVFEVNDTARLILEDVTLDTLDSWGVWQLGGDVEVTGSTFIDVGSFNRAAAIQTQNGTSLTIEQSTFTMGYSTVYVWPDDAFLLVVRDVEMIDTDAGVDGRLQLGVAQLERVRVVGSDNDGVNLSAPTLTVTSCTFSGSTYAGMSLRTYPATNLTIRDTVFEDNRDTGLRVRGDVGSTFDLGTLSEPGNNVFQRNVQPLSNDGNLYMDVDDAAVTVFAVGNTWDPLIQGADASGRYTTAPGTALDITAATAPMDGNYRKTARGTLRLAEEP